MVKTSNALLTVLLSLVLSAGVAMAQQDHAAMTDQSQTKPGSEDMMKGCQMHRSGTIAALDKLEKTIAAGRKSKDPSKMKAALDAAQKQVAEAKHQMSRCPMMSGDNMHDGGMEHTGHMNDVSGDSEKH
jgi:hypothetical protein